MPLGYFVHQSKTKLQNVFYPKSLNVKQITYDFTATTTHCVYQSVFRVLGTYNFALE
jgi:hypothetical protein